MAAVRRWIVLAGLALTSCSKKVGDEEKPVAGAEPRVKAMEDFADRMCACKDGACLSAINTDFVKERDPIVMGSTAQEKRFKTASDRYSECATTAIAAAKANPGPEGAESFAKTAESFADEVCACTNLRCVETITDRLASWKKQWATALAAATPTPEQAKRTTDATTRLNECTSKLLASAEAGLQGAPDAAAAALPSALPPNCQKFKKVVEAFASCDTVTPAIRDNIFKAYGDLEKTDSLCLQGIEALKEPAGRLGCTLPE